MIQRIGVPSFESPRVVRHLCAWEATAENPTLPLFSSSSPSKKKKVKIFFDVSFLFRIKFSLKKYPIKIIKKKKTNSERSTNGLNRKHCRNNAESEKALPLFVQKVSSKCPTTGHSTNKIEQNQNQNITMQESKSAVSKSALPSMSGNEHDGGTAQHWTSYPNHIPYETSTPCQWAMLAG